MISAEAHVPRLHHLPVMGGLFLPSDTRWIYFGLHEFCMILFEFKCAQHNLSKIYVIILCVCACGVCCTHTEAVPLPCAITALPSFSAPQRWAESLKERLSTAVFVRGREGVSAWGLPACLARACPYCQPGPSLPLRTAGTLVLNQRPIYPRHTPPAK